MNFVLDMGNTFTKFALFRGEKLLKKKILSTLSREKEEWKKILERWLEKEKLRLEKIVACTTKPSAFPPLKKAVKEVLKLSLKEVRASSVNFPILYRNSSQIGGDRIANAVAARELYSLPVVVVDLGTCVHLEVVSKRGELLGGLIFPGPQSFLDLLTEKAERLPPTRFRKPYRVIGKTTRENLLAGSFYTLRGGIKEIIKKIEEEMGEKSTVVLTGGWAKLFEKENFWDRINPNLTLQGLNFIALKYLK